MSRHPGKFTWFEHVSSDPAKPRKALAFYESVFGYTHDDMDMGAQGIYYVIKSPDGKGRGGITQSPDAALPAMWTPYVRVEDADAIAARAGPLGGKLALTPRDI